MTTRLFTSWVRRGAAGAIVEPDPLIGPYAGPATFQPLVTLARDGAAQPPLAGPRLPVLGPGMVVGLDARAVVRTDPAPGATGVEDNHLALIELARPDLPWLFTPARASATNRLRPWLVLVVVDAARIQLQPGTPLPRIAVNDADLPDLNDSWAWAHAQVTVDDPQTAQQALDPPSGGAAVSRLVCPRRLQPDVTYLACLVPATKVGAQAGLGLPPDPGPGLAPAWTAGAGQDVVLPVYYSWTFATGDAGDFKSLVQRLVGVKPDSIAGFGTRTVDLSAPWETPPQLGDGMTIELDGALGIGVERPGTLTDAARAAFEARLTRLLDFPADRQPGISVGDPTLSAVAPPIYAARHAGAVRVPTTPGWLQTLNLDPRRRIAAGFGTRYVQDHKEFLMARAWDQLGAVQEANRLRALAEMAGVIADRLHVRHIQTLGSSELFSVAAPARTRVIPGGTTTLHAVAASTPLPTGAATVAFTRMARPRGPLGRRAFARATPTVIEQGLRGAVRAAAPPTALDGIGAMVSAPDLNVLAIDATGRMAARGWQLVTVAEQNISNPGNLAQIRQALDTRVSARQGFGLIKGTPVLLDFGPKRTITDPHALATNLTAALVPSSRITRRLDGRVRVPGSLGGGTTTRPAMACPDFPAPLGLALLQDHPDYVLPGLGNFPDDRVTLLVADAAFVEAFLAGANHEMNREFLWREYPTDQRGTPFRHFWPRPDGNPDIPPITAWAPTAALGANGAANGPDVERMLVLLVRGEVLRRYPRTIVYAAPGRIDADRHLALDTSVAWTPPQFLLRIDRTTTAFAYPLTRPDVHSDLSHADPAQDKAGWYFVFSEPVTGPRFKFGEVPSAQFDHWTDLAWGSVPQARGFAVAAAALASPAQEAGPGSPRWNNDSADVARIAFARPFRVGYHADQLLAGV